jgi:hypothetical protein
MNPKIIKAFAIVAKSKILSVAQYPVLEIYKHRADAKQAVEYIERDSAIKYVMKIVPVEITIREINP